MKPQQLTFSVPSMKPARPPSARRGRKTRAAKRDEVLGALGMDTTRAELIEKATEIAVKICRAKGWVTSVDVMAMMREDAELVAMLNAVDPRFMGAVLLPSRGWVKLDYIGAGSKGRPIPRWTRKP